MPDSQLQADSVLWELLFHMAAVTADAEGIRIRDTQELRDQKPPRRLRLRL